MARSFVAQHATLVQQFAAIWAAAIIGTENPLDVVIPVRRLQPSPSTRKAIPVNHQARNFDCVRLVPEEDLAGTRTLFLAQVNGSHHFLQAVLIQIGVIVEEGNILTCGSLDAHIAGNTPSGIVASFDNRYAGEMSAHRL